MINWIDNDEPEQSLPAVNKTRSDILQGQALFIGVKQLRRCLVILKNLALHILIKRWTKDKETDRQKEKRQEKTRKEEKKKERDIQKEKKQTEKLRANSWEIIEG